MKMATKRKKAAKRAKSTGSKKGQGSKKRKAKAAKKASSAKAAEAANAKCAKVKTDSKKSSEGKRVSALDAAAKVLQKAGTAMRARELIDAMAEQGLWTSPGGKTPWATLHAAMIREINNKGKDSRFKKVDRGQFTFNG